MQRLVFAVLAGLVPVAVGCASTPKKEETLAPTPAPPDPVKEFRKPAPKHQEEMPLWVELGSGAFVSKRFGPSFFGVAPAEPADDASVLRRNAKSAAYEALAVELESAFMEILERWSKKHERDLEEVRGAVSAYARDVAAKSDFVDAWRDPQKPHGETPTYGITVMTIADLKRQLMLERNLEPGLRNFILGDLDMWFRQKTSG